MLKILTILLLSLLLPGLFSPSGQPTPTAPKETVEPAPLTLPEIEVPIMTGTPKPKSTPKRTAAPKPTATPEATAEPEPSATPEPTIEPGVYQFPRLP